MGLLVRIVSLLSAEFKLVLLSNILEAAQLFVLVDADADADAEVLSFLFLGLKNEYNILPAVLYPFCLHLPRATSNRIVDDEIFTSLQAWLMFEGRTLLIFDGRREDKDEG